MRLSFCIMPAFLLLLSIQEIMAQVDLQGRIIPIGKRTLQVKRGDVFDAIIEVWPAERLKRIDSTHLVNKKILNLFHVAIVKSMSLSENNQDVLQIKVSLILMKNFKDMSLHLLEMGGEEIPVHLSNIEVLISDENGPNKYILLDHFELDRKFESLLLPLTISISLIASLLVPFFIVKRVRKKRKRELNRKLINGWDMIFLNASTRKDYEGIYLRKDEWTKLLKVSPMPVRDFLESIKYHQYKRDWNEQEMLEVRNYFEEIRGIFSNHDV